MTYSEIYNVHCVNPYNRRKGHTNILAVGGTKSQAGSTNYESESKILARERRAICSAGWTDVSGVCTMNIDTPLNWWDAHLDCIQRGGYLSTKDNVAVPLNVADCPSGSTVDASMTSCYELTNIKGTLQEARNYCQSKGGDVPDVVSDSDIQTILGKVSEQSITSPTQWNEGLWIGQNFETGTWSYLSDTGLSVYVDWASGQPSGEVQDTCAVIIYDDVNAVAGTYGKMYATRCDNAAHKIMCKYKAGAWIGAAWVTDTPGIKYVDDLPLISPDVASPTDKCILERGDGALDSATCDSLHPYVCREGSLTTLSSSIRTSVIAHVATVDVECPVAGSPTEAFYSSETNKCYWLTAPAASWDDTTTACNQNLNATMVVIENVHEANFLYTKVLEKNPSFSYIWIGARYQSAWVDINGLPLTYTNWVDGTVNEACVSINGAKNGMWDSLTCHFPLDGLCEVKAPIPTTTTMPTTQQITTEAVGSVKPAGVTNTDEPTLEVTLEKIYTSLISVTQPVTDDTVLAILAEVTSLIMTSEALTSKSIDILLNITDALTEVSAQSQEMFEEILDISDLILNEENKEGLINDASPHTFANFLQCMDSFAALIASTGAATDAVISKNNLDLHTANNIKPDVNDYYQEITGEGYKSALAVSYSIFQENLGNIAVIVYKNLHEAASTLDLKEKYRETFNSHIYSVSFVLKDGQEVDFTDGFISFFFKLIEDTTHEQRCSFWKPVIGIWSSEGCELDEKATNETHTVCRCNHLTNFAVLMQYTEMIDLGVHEDALEYMTYIGISLSILCLIVTLLIYLLGKLLKSQRIIIHANLAMSLLIGQVLFIGGVDATHNPNICAAVAFMLHYFFLAAFSWMLIEGIHLYMKSRMVFGKDVKTWIFFVLGWGLPAVIVSITFAVRHDGYGEEGSGKCWLSTEHGLTWAFIGPVLAIILINTIILGLVIRVFMTLKANADKTERERIKVGLRAILMLQPLLGLSWLFGLFGVNEHTVVFQYLFVLCNSLQGVFIFLLHCITNEEVRNIFLKRYKKMASSVHSTSSGTASSTLTETTQHSIVKPTKPETDEAIQGSTNSKKAWL
ncbi:uncharacterized protein LOC144442051 [Glandiceps talaboti]